MAKKRGRRVSHRKTDHRVVARKSAVASRTRSNSTNIRIVMNNLIIFFILFLISLVLFSFLPKESILSNLFFIFLLGFGFISIAFFITLLVFFFLKLFRKRR